MTQLNREELVEKMIAADDAETMRCEDCPSCKGTGIIRISHDPQYCSCGGGQIFPATDESRMRAVLKAIGEYLPDQNWTDDDIIISIYTQLKNICEGK